MATINCPQCGAPIASDEEECRYCGKVLKKQSSREPKRKVYQQPEPVIPQVEVLEPSQIQNFPPQPYVDPASLGINPDWPVRNKSVAGLLAIFLGGLGIHKFYLGHYIAGILYLIFCWTYIPGIIGFFEGLVYLTQNDYVFQVKNRVRLK